MPDAWHYAMKLLPERWSAAEVNDIVKQMPRELVGESFLIATPGEVSDQLKGYVDAGVNG
jgi:hypothetical protein